MRKSVFVFIVAFLGIASAFAEAAPPGAGFDWSLWRDLPVQDGGRQKPFDTLALESTRMMTGQTGFTDPETGDSLDATAFYLSLLLDWQGWDRETPFRPSGDEDFSEAYFRAFPADKWDTAPLLLVGSSELWTALGLEAGEKYVAPAEVKDLKVQDSHFGMRMPFLAWAEHVGRLPEKKMSRLEKKGRDLAERYLAYLTHRMGLRMEIVPVPDDPHRHWESVASIVQPEQDGKGESRDKLREMKNAFSKVREAFRKRDASAFNRASSEWIAAVEAIGPTRGEYPAQRTMAWEVAYNHVAPFRLAWILSLAACAVALGAKFTKSKWLYAAGFAVYFAAIGFLFYGFTMRALISGRAPITNMYESLLSVGLGIALMGTICELVYRKHYYLIEASIMSAFVLCLADMLPTAFDPSIRPLLPVLRNNFWLWTHVTAIMLSYAAFARAWILSNISLGFTFSAGRENDFQKNVDKLTLLLVRLGIFLLAVGTILGGVWADYSWGRFWGWDSKETWALITLLIYLMILHARYAGWIAPFGVAVCSAMAFVAVLMTWYGVNFVLGTGLHSYGTGGGGETYVIVGLALQFAYLGAAVVWKAARNSPRVGQAEHAPS